MRNRVLLALALVVSVPAWPAAGAEKADSEVDLSVAKSRDEVIAFGTVAPPHKGRRIVVRLVHSVDDVQAVIVKRPRLGRTVRRADGTRASRFVVRFDRPRDGSCKVKAVFRGDADHLRSRQTIRLDAPTPDTCRVPTFDRGSATFARGDGSVVTKDMLLAQTGEQHAYGLMYRKWLHPEVGMAFVFDSDRSGGFWMKNTLIPLSIAFYDSSGTILRILDMDPCDQSSTDCPVYEPGVTYRGTIEVNQGAFERWGVAEGDVVVVNGT